MGKNSSIEWCTHTFNPFIGCTKISDGCKFCYAEAIMDKRWGKVQWGPQGERKRTSPAYWRQPLRWNEEAKAAGRRPRVFCGSLCDVFEDRHGIDPLSLWRAQLWQLISDTPNLDWLLLTKRPENALRMLPKHWRPLPNNIWIGTSVENQETADKRIPDLLKTPAAVRFLSCEPLLGPINLGRAVGCGYYCDEAVGHVDHAFWTPGIASPIHWVIVGGESGPHARPFEVMWAVDLMGQCADADVPFFWKQMGDHLIDRHGERIRLKAKGGDWSEWPEELRHREFPS